MDDESLEKLAHPEYWDVRYTAEGEGQTYDWFKSYPVLAVFFTKHIPLSNPLPRILHLGCGSSTLSDELYKLGHQQQINVDFSPVVIASMEAASPEMQWLVMDVRNLDFSDASFDVAIDKGTLDAMIHGSPWNPPEDVRSNICAYVDEVHRVLKPGGKWLYVTYRQPHFITPLLDRPGLWSLSIERLNSAADQGGVFEYFAYILMKGAKS